MVWRRCEEGRVGFFQILHPAYPGSNYGNSFCGAQSPRGKPPRRGSRLTAAGRQRLTLQAARPDSIPSHLFCGGSRGVFLQTLSGDLFSTFSASL